MKGGVAAGAGEEEGGGDAEEREGSEEAQGAEGDDAEAEAVAPLTFLEGACCDSDGHCQKCPGPDEDYNFWDNLYIFPGDETVCVCFRSSRKQGRRQC